MKARACSIDNNEFCANCDFFGEHCNFLVEDRHFFDKDRHKFVHHVQRATPWIDPCYNRIANNFERGFNP